MSLEPSRAGNPTPPRLLTIAGSDSGGGAGIQADLKTFAAFGGYGMSAITALTAQNTRQVTAVHEAPPEMVAAQIAAVFEDIGVDAVKIGMLASAPIIEAVAEALETYRDGDTPPVVLDPVMVAKSGDALLRDDAIDALRRRLLPLATLVTPNLPEAERLTGLPVSTDEEALAAAKELAKGGLAEAGTAVLLKGGHRRGDEIVDLLVDPRAQRPEDRERRFRHPRVATSSTHGTGCTLSSAIAAGLGSGATLASSIDEAIQYLHGALVAAFPLGHGHGPVHHLYRLQ
ncbi:MAG: bifunctional hydroxymethylpyrimidine kinase/phosphomethylpyrimidine kinase [Acidobacteriota bacterium]|nr:bifunctional hydroxymethylpyrimidine kinase/phosphomethylpyrimidine kinase [Acidobacteriota bacterium]